RGREEGGGGGREMGEGGNPPPLRLKMGRLLGRATPAAEEHSRGRCGHLHRWVVAGDLSPNQRLPRRCDLVQKKRYRGCNRRLHNRVAILLTRRNGPSLRRVAPFWRARQRGSSAQKLNPHHSGDPAYQT